MPRIRSRTDRPRSRLPRVFLACLPCLAAAAVPACRHGTAVAPVQLGEIAGVLLAPPSPGRETRSIVADGPAGTLVAGSGPDLVGNNSMGLDGILPGRSVLALSGGAGVPVLGALIRLMDGAARQIPGASVVFTGAGGAFRLYGVPVGRVALVDAAYAVRGAPRVGLAIVAPAGRQSVVLVDAPASVAAARAMEAAQGRLDALEPDRVTAAAAVLRQLPAALEGLDLSSREALAAAFGRAAATDPAIAAVDPAPASIRFEMLRPSSEPAPTALPSVPATATPSPAATAPPSPRATATATPSPEATATPGPVTTPTPSPTPAAPPRPGAAPNPAPTVAPTVVPTAVPTASPTVAPTVAPTAVPTGSPTAIPGPTPTSTETPTPDGGVADPGMPPDGVFDLPPGFDPDAGFVWPPPEATESPDT